MALFRRLRTILGLRQAATTEKWPWPNINIGRHTYGIKPSSIFGSDQTVEVTVGAFCSIGKEVLFLSRANHPIHTASTFPIRSFGKKDDDLTSKGPIVIGNDVWIGQRAIIMSGVRIGDGSIIGAGSIVTKNVAPYAIVAGNPARFVRFRFDADIANRLAASKWWEWPDEVILRNVDDFDLPAEEFLSKHGF